MAAARRWGPHGRGEEPGPRGSAHGARGARSPARARSLNSTARSSRAAVPQAVRSWQRRRAGALGVPLPHLESPGLSRPPAVSSSGVFLSFGGRASSPESAFSKPGEWPRAQGSRRRRGARRPPGGGGLPWVLRPARAVQSSDGLGRTKTQHPVSLARPHAFLFSCLTNPRIIQLRKCWKEVS